MCCRGRRSSKQGIAAGATHRVSGRRNEPKFKTYRIDRDRAIEGEHYSPHNDSCAKVLQPGEASPQEDDRAEHGQRNHELEQQDHEAAVGVRGADQLTIAFRAGREADECG
jgi:hypothetical protein